MKEILEQTPRRLVVKLGSRFTNSALCSFDKSVGKARFERTVFGFKRKPIEVALSEIATVEVVNDQYTTNPGQPGELTTDTYYPRVLLRSGKRFWLSQGKSEDSTRQVVAEMVAFVAQPVA